MAFFDPVHLLVDERPVAVYRSVYPSPGCISEYESRAISLKRLYLHTNRCAVICVSITDFIPQRGMT
jgi:hypothetical protein